MLCLVVFIFLALYLTTSQRNYPFWYHILPKNLMKDEMLKNHPQIVLFRPEIPQNTGNIGRLAAATGCRMHLIKPFGFSTTDKNLRRAGLDYWPFLDLEIHDNLDKLMALSKSPPALITKFGKKSYTEIPKETDFIVFGQETSGLPDEVMQKYADHQYSIPMFHEGVRSLNLSNSVAIIVYKLLEKHQNEK